MREILGCLPWRRRLKEEVDLTANAELRLKQVQQDTDPIMQLSEGIRREVAENHWGDTAIAMFRGR